MRKLLLLLLLITTPAWAVDNSKVEVRGSVNDETSNVLDSGLITKYFTSGARQQQTISLDSVTYTNIAVPVGAKAVLIDVGTATGLQLKGVTGDVGISLDSTVPILIPISDDRTTTTLGIRNGNTTTRSVKVFWF